MHDIKWLMAAPEGFEPSTRCLEGSCSIQLSYGTVPAFYRRLLVMKSELGSSQ